MNMLPITGLGYSTFWIAKNGTPSLSMTLEWYGSTYVGKKILGIFKLAYCTNGLS